MHTTALITGASGGLGEEFAKLCAKDGLNLVLVARNKEKLDALAQSLIKHHNVRCLVLQTDLSEPNAIDEIIQHLKKESIEIDVLINNAGFGSYGLFAEMDFTEEKQMLEVNVFALTELTKKLLPGMIQRKTGKILNVASTAAFQPGPLMAVYFATKAYVLSFSQAIERELADTGVTVTCLCPGPTSTGFEKRAHMGESKLFKRFVMNPYDVAKQGYDAMNAGRSIVIPGMRNKLGRFAVRFVTLKFAARVAGRMQQ